MQFIPSTWQVVKVDADGDGKRNPQDIDDAALATAVYLCSGKDNLSTRKGQEASVFRYNHSQDYVNLVLRIMEAYCSGDYTAVPSGTQGGTSFSPLELLLLDRPLLHRSPRAQGQAAPAAKQRQRALAASGGTSSSGGGTGPRHQRRHDRRRPRHQRHGGSPAAAWPAPVGGVVGWRGRRRVGGAVKGATGGGGSGGGGSGGSDPAPAPVKRPVVTAAEAKVHLPRLRASAPST